MSRSLLPSISSLLALLTCGLLAPFDVAVPAESPASGVAPADVNQPSTQTLRIDPKPLPHTLFEFEGRVEISNLDASFDVPPAYQESFSYWIGRLKGVHKSELIQFMSRTEGIADDGTVRFRKQVPRYSLEIKRPGKLPASASRNLFADVKALIWEGTLDRYGNVREMNQTSSAENKDIENLGFPILHHLFPRIDGPRDLEVGESFRVEERVDMPSRLTIHGLEEIGLILHRTYTLKESGPDAAVFTVEVRYTADPKRPPRSERTTCVISGGGAGDAVFDMRNGVFLESDLRTTMTIDIEAPLRKLPEQGENDDPGTGTTQIVLQVRMKGKQTVSVLKRDDAR